MNIASIKVSIIVAVYNASEYLGICLKSLLDQTHKNLQILLINDGSTDNSGTICDTFASKDDRITVIHKNNGGVCSARQAGLDTATGEYIIHVDPDDWAEPDMIEKMLSFAVTANVDMVICDYFIESSKRYYIAQNITSCDNHALISLLLGQKLHGALWNKLVKRRAYLQIDYKMPEKWTRWEDLYTCIALINGGIKIAYLNQAFYHYHMFNNSNSLSRNNLLPALYSQVDFIKKLPNIVNIDKFKIEINECKYATLELAFSTCKLQREEFLAIYPEVHSSYLIRPCTNYVQFFCKRAISGSYARSLILYALFSKAFVILRTISRKLTITKNNEKIYYINASSH